MDRFHKASILALIILSVSVTWEGIALPAPGRNSIITPGGQAIPCTYDNYQDSGSFLGKDCKTGDNKFSETTAYKLWTDELASGVASFWEPGTWDFTTGGGLGATIIDFTGITLWGIYNQTIFKCSTTGCDALIIGNQNAIDTNYHAQGIYVHDLTFDGGSATTSTGLSITTAFDVDIDHVIIQNTRNIGSGGLSISNWNSQQILSKNIFIHHSLFLATKTVISGTINGYMEYCFFQGMNPAASTSTPLIDFSKGDISPTGANMLSNFDFDHNTIYGWTGKFMAGFQAVNNDTITYNFVQDASNLMSTVAVTGQKLNGLMLAFNTFTKSSGTVHFDYGTNLQFTNNQWLIDSTPNTLSSALEIGASSTVAPNIILDALVQGNQISKWGGIGMVLNFSRGAVYGNDIYDVNQGNGNANAASGLFIEKGLLNVPIQENIIVSDVASGAGASRPVQYSTAAKNDTMTNNQFFYETDTSPSGGIFFGVSKDSTFQIRYNRGYVTENQGSCSISASTTCTVTHGLAGTPTSIQITAGTTGTGVYYVTSVGATTFVITVATSGTYTMYWEARYWP